MKKATFLLFFFLFPFSSHAAITLVSDLDDTIKITNSGSITDATINGVFTTKVFTGMPEFLEASRFYVNETHVLTASPALIGPRVHALLNKYDISYESIILRSTFGGISKLDYKVNALKYLLENSSDDFILIGDDVGEDPEAYDTIMKLYPGRVIAHYIHVVKGRKFPASAFSYWTSLDLALKEYQAGRMGRTTVTEAADLLLEEKKMSRIVPSFANCPTDRSVWNWQSETEFAALASQVSERLTRHCQARHSGK